MQSGKAWTWAALVLFASSLLLVGCGRSRGNPNREDNTPQPSVDDQVARTRMERKITTELQGVTLASMLDFITQRQKIIFDVRWDELEKIGVGPEQIVKEPVLHHDIKTAIRISFDRALYDAQLAAGKTEAQVAAMTNRPTWYISRGIVIITTMEAAEGKPIP